MSEPETPFRVKYTPLRGPCKYPAEQKPGLLQQLNREIKRAEENDGDDPDHQSLDDPFPAGHYSTVVVLDGFIETFKHRIALSARLRVNWLAGQRPRPSLCPVLRSVLSRHPS